MTDPLIGATAQVLLEKILSLATARIGLVFGVKKDMERLRRAVATIQAVLADAEKMQQQNEAVKRWLRSIEEVAYEADDVFDKLNYELLRRKVETTQSPLKDKVCFFFSFSSTFTFRWRMARKVRDINLKLKSINEEANGFGLQYQAASGSNTIVQPPNRETDSVVDQNVVGRDMDASKVVQRLLNPSGEAVSFIPITGMGGIGKTTLAQSVYNDAQIDKYFDRKIWVCVSNNFEATRVFKLMLESLWRRKVDIVSRDAIVQEIKMQLEGKRYLLILDDVWEENSTHRAWDDFSRSLAGISTGKGNWGLVTTRQLTVASMVTNKEPHVPLEVLSGDDCWQILKRKAFPSGEVPEELNAMKQEIIEACKGVPLVARVIGGLLSIHAKEVWLSIVRNEIRTMSGSVMGILRLSFDYLPSASIKKCFAYCSLFKKDSDIRTDMLIQLWMAEGFLQSDHENEMEMEATGSRCFDILVRSSLFQEVRDQFGFRCGRMHDLIHDLAQKVSEPGTIYLGEGERNDMSGVRCLALNSWQANMQAMLQERSCLLRTVFAECEIPNHLLPNFRNLRVFNSSVSAVYFKFPNSICKLINLRYLHLSLLRVGCLPESLCKLYNLQTLRIYCIFPGRFSEFLEGISNLISLRHLHCEFSTEDVRMPLRMGSLTCLQTLEFFNIGGELGRRIEEIGRLKNLSGTLTIRNLQLVNGKEEARLANLFSKSKLIDLSFRWAEDREGDNDDENVLEGLEPHPNLEKLKVENFMGTRFPSWTMKMGFNKLENLELINCKRCEEIPKLGQLPLLRFLNLQGLDKIRCIGVSFYGVDDCSTTSPGQVSKKLFPALRSLRLQNLPNLVDWMGAETLLARDDTIQVFPSLEELTILHCPQLVTVPNHFQSLVELALLNAGSNAELLISSICNKVTALTKLTINDASELTCIPDVVFINNQKSLETLNLIYCSSLTHVASCSISACKNLRDVCIQTSRNFKSIVVSSTSGQKKLPSTLQSLRILHCHGLISLPGELVQSCTSLAEICVSNCSNLESFQFDLGRTPSLSYLNLIECPKLITMPKGTGNLYKLSGLEIGPFPDSVEYDWVPLLSSLSVGTLKLYGSSRSVSLPDQLQHVAQITELHLRRFGSMESLPDWLENFASLESLFLMRCEKLKYLPSAGVMRRLTNLQRLWIDCCPMLAERCTPSSGPNSEWSKISHIPEIMINGRCAKRPSQV